MLIQEHVLLEKSRSPSCCVLISHSVFTHLTKQHVVYWRQNVVYVFYV